MKIVLVCIAKNEDNYIHEWIEYYFSLGISDIIIYQNDWNYDLSSYKHVKCIQWDNIDRSRESPQLKSYNDFIFNRSSEYDWACFFDVDEFLTLRQYKTLDKYLEEKKKYLSLGVNWKLFGNNNLDFNGDYRVLARFTQCQHRLNKHVKIMLNLQKIRELNEIVYFVNPHYLNIHDKKQCYATDGITLIDGPFNENYTDDNIYLNHYFCKTKYEYQIRAAYAGANNPNKYKSMKLFNENNLNDVSNTIALERYIDYKIKNISDIGDTTVIVSMATIKERILNGSFTLAIQSLVRQQVEDKFKIIVNVAAQDENFLDKNYMFENNIYLNIANEDLKPHNKYFYSMLRFKNNIIITVDDDRIYKNDFVQTVLQSYYKNKGAIICCYASQIRFDTCKYTHDPVEKNKEFIYGIPYGADGVLYPPNILQISEDDINDIYDFLLQDDIFLAYKSISKNIKKICLDYNSAEKDLSYLSDFRLDKVNNYNDKLNDKAILLLKTKLQEK